MKMRLTTMVATATGYYLGAKAGEQRYHQILWLTRTIKNSQAYRNLVARLKEIYASAVEALTGKRPEGLTSGGQGQQA